MYVYYECILYFRTSNLLEMEVVSEIRRVVDDVGSDVTTESNSINRSDIVI